MTAPLVDPRYGQNVTDWHSWQEGRRFGRAEATIGLPRFVIWLWWKATSVETRPRWIRRWLP